MTEQIKVTGMVTSVMPIGEYDKRVTLITKERGRITAFSRGSRRPKSSMLGSTQPFVFGEFVLVEGRDSYTLVAATISNYFMELRQDADSACYGFYFLEFANYYGRENNNELELLKLLYQAVHTLCKDILPKPLIRSIFELKIMVINGEYPEVYHCVRCGSETGPYKFSCQAGGILCDNCKTTYSDSISIHESTLYTLQFIISTPVEKLFAFKVSDQVGGELQKIIKRYMSMYIDKKFKSLEILESMA